ncbi:MAG: hypothetical protein ACOCWW_04265, partial [Bacteroidota bacterium]
MLNAVVRLFRNLIVLGISGLAFLYPVWLLFKNNWQFDIISSVHWRHLRVLIETGWNINTSYELSFILSAISIPLIFIGAVPYVLQVDWYRKLKLNLLFGSISILFGHIFKKGSSSTRARGGLFKLKQKGLSKNINALPLRMRFMRQDKKRKLERILEKVKIKNQIKSDVSSALGKQEELKNGITQRSTDINHTTPEEIARGRQRIIETKIPKESPPTPTQIKPEEVSEVGEKVESGGIPKKPIQKEEEKNVIQTPEAKQEYELPKASTTVPKSTVEAAPQIQTIEEEKKKEETDGKEDLKKRVLERFNTSLKKTGNDKKNGENKEKAKPGEKKTESVKSAAGDTKSKPAETEQEENPEEEEKTEKNKVLERLSQTVSIIFSQFLEKSGFRIIPDVQLGKYKMSFVGLSKQKAMAFLIDDQHGDWLADEKSFKGGDPMWFSED